MRHSGNRCRTRILPRPYLGERIERRSERDEEGGKEERRRGRRKREKATAAATSAGPVKRMAHDTNHSVFCVSCSPLPSLSLSLFLPLFSSRLIFPRAKKEILASTLAQRSGFSGAHESHSPRVFRVKKERERKNRGKRERERNEPWP